MKQRRFGFMIILISGNSCTGKTLMAQTLLEKYQMPYLSIDHLKMGLYRGMSECGYTPTDSNEVIGARLWPIIKGIIMTNIENNQNLIIEGCYLLPHVVNEIERIYPNEIISVFLGFSTNYINENMSNIIYNRNAIETRNYTEDRTINDFIQEHIEFKGLCQGVGVQYFEIDRNYKEEICKVYDYIETKKRRMCK
jgi:putative acetyltransferase